MILDSLRHAALYHPLGPRFTAGLDFLRAVREAFPADEAGPLTPEETLERFEKIYPGFKEWAKEA